MADDIVERLHEEIDSVKVDVQVLRDAITEIERLRADNAGLRFRLADLRRAIDHDPATCALFVCNRCDPWEARRG